MSDADLVAATQIPLRFIQAIRDVESNGHPDSIRFEPHLFHRDRPLSPLCTDDVAWSHHVRHTGAEILAHADPAELAAVPYTPDPGRPGRPPRAASAVAAETNRAAFDRAYAIAPERAVRASSWGAFQVLGWALLPMGKTTAGAVAAFFSDPATISDRLLVAWCSRHAAAIDAAKRGDVADWVAIYNGSSGASAARYIAHLEAALRMHGAS